MPSLDLLKQLHVLVVHPDGPDGDIIIRHLQRIGCQVEGMWPPPAKLPRHVDVVYYLVNENTRHSLPWHEDQPLAAFVAVLEHESRDPFGLLSDCSPHAVISKRADPFAILTSLIVARNIFRYEDRLHTKIRKLDETLRAARMVEKAKSILMKSKNIQEKEAYAYMRKHAMDRRMPIGKVASAIVEASGILV